MIENTNTKQFYPGPILNNTLEITDFLFNDAEQIKITHSKLNGEGTLIDIDLNYPTDYEVIKVLPSAVNAAEAALTASTGQIILKNVSVLAGEKLTVYRVSQIIQNKDYPRTGAFPAATHEGALDYLTMQNQEQREELARSLKVPISTPNFNAAVPIPLPKRILRINEESSSFEFVPYDLDERLDTFEDTVVDNITAGQEAIENSFEEFKNETNITINNIDTKVTNAVDTANTANIKSDEAIDIANTASAAATNAVNTANSAVTSADTAVATANNADIKSDEALLTSQEAKEASLIAEENATTAKEKVDIFEQDIETVLEAADQIAQLEGAVDTAVQASEAATRAAEDATQAAENAIAALDSKLDIDGTAVKAIADADGNIITETYRTIADSYDKNDVNTLLDNKADRDLSNLTEQGQSKFDEKANKDFSNVVEIAEGSLVDNELKNKLNKQQITNCLSEKPQRIKLELNNGILTLKAGSILTIPYGTENKTAQYPVGSTFLNNNFKVYETQFAHGKFFVRAEVQSDIVDETVYGGGVKNRNIAVKINTNLLHAQIYQASGNSTTTATYTRYYNTDTNLIGQTSASETITYDVVASFPIALTTVALENTRTTISIDRIFNGIGCIGGTIWVDKGVKGLAVNGRNTDGTLKNKEVVFDSISISSNITVGSYSTPYYVYGRTDNLFRFAGKLTHFEQNEKPTLSSTYGAWYSPAENLLRFTNNRGVTWVVADGYVPVADIVAANNTITEFKPRETFRAIDYNDKSEVSGWSMPSSKYIDLVFGAAGTTYTAPANGWFNIAVRPTVAGHAVGLHNLNNGFSVNSRASSASTYTVANMPVRKGDVISLSYDGSPTLEKFIFIYAEGEV